jgi:hypothetical protein
VFSPDGSAFLFSTADAAVPAWAFSIPGRSEVAIGNPLRSALTGNAVFMGPNQVASVNRREPSASGVFSWPAGKQLQKLVIPDRPLASVTKGPALLLRPFNDYAVAALSVEDKQIFQVSRNPAMDRYEDIEAAERKTGEVALYAGRKTEPFATLQLPEADLAHAFGRVFGGSGMARRFDRKPRRDLEPENRPVAFYGSLYNRLYFQGWSLDGDV